MIVEEHRYVVRGHEDVAWRSVTQTVDECFEKFDADKCIATMMRGRKWNASHRYWGKSPAQIKAEWEANGVAAAAAGTAMHAAIEAFYNNPDPAFRSHRDAARTIAAAADDPATPTYSVEWRGFLRFVADHPDLVPFRSEWRVYDEDVGVAGSIDMVFVNADNTLSIYDWKRCAEISQHNPFNRFSTHPTLPHIPDTKYWHYALQLNIYRYILERKYGHRVKELFLVQLHPSLDKPYQLHALRLLDDDVCALLEGREQDTEKNGEEEDEEDEEEGNNHDNDVCLL